MRKNTALFIIFFIALITGGVLLLVKYLPKEGGGKASLAGDWIEWNETLKGYEVVKGSSKLTSEITIPALHDGSHGKAPVVAIAPSAFSECNYIKKVNFEKGSRVSSIGSGAFRSCTALSYIELPESVAEIAGNAFPGCTKLADVSINPNNKHFAYQNGGIYSKDLTELVCAIMVPGYNTFNLLDSTTTLREACFATNQQLKHINFQSNVKLIKIERLAFARCPNLKTVTLPASIATIEQQAFSHCEALTSVTIPETAPLSSIEERTFYSCQALNSFVLPSNVVTIKADAFASNSQLTTFSFAANCKLATIETDAFSACSSLVSLMLPDKVSTISETAFRESGLSTITIPASTNSIELGEKSAFVGCSKLSNIIVNDNNLSYSSVGGVLYNKNGTALLLYPSNGAKTFEVPASVMIIADRAFCDCQSVERITFAQDSQLVSIESHGFYNCKALYNISLPSTLSALGNNAFAYTALTSITIPENINIISPGTFFSCSRLTALSFADNSQLQAIANSAFYGCTLLATVTLPQSLTTIGNKAFYNASALTSITIPSNVALIEKEAFANCGNLKTTIFNDTSTWYKTSSDTNTEGETIGLSSNTANATLLSNTYSEYRWYKK